MADLEKISKMKQKGRISVGGLISDSTAGLFLYANAIDLDALSSVLGVQPTECIRRGEVVGKRKPAPVGYWNLEAPADLPFEEKLSYLLGSTTNDASTWDSLSRIHDIQLRCAFFLHSWTEGVELPADIIKEIGKRHWKFGLSVYSAEGDEIIDAFLSEEKDKRDS
jgi:hypothetical protein